MVQKYRIVVIIVALSMVLAALPMLTVRANSGSNPEIFVCPSTINAVENNAYTVYINVVNVTNLYAWEFQLNYSTSILSYNYASVVPGGLNAPYHVFQNVTDTTNGHLWLAVSSVYPAPATGISYTNQSIFEVNFQAIATGISPLQLYGTILANPSGNAITPLTTVSGSITVGTRALTVTSITVLNYGCSIYANDTYGGSSPYSGNPYYVPVLVTIQNTGTIDAGAFHVTLNVTWLTGSEADGSGELAVASLAADTSVTLNFTSVFHPTHLGYYALNATADDRNEVVQSSRTGRSMIYSPGSGIEVTIIGDINGDKTVSILDAVTIALAWNSNPASPNWNIQGDINHDGSVNILDATRIGLNWGKSW